MSCQGLFSSAPYTNQSEIPLEKKNVQHQIPGLEQPGTAHLYT